MKSNKIRSLSLLLTGLLLTVIFLCTVPALAKADVSTKPPSSTIDIVAGWVDPTNAYANDAAYACSKTRGAAQGYGGYDFNILSGSTISQVRVRLDAWCEGDDDIKLEVSTDGGATYLATSFTVNLATSEETYWVDITGWTTWIVEKLNSDNIRTKVTHVKVAALDNVRLDWIPIEVTYTPPAFDFSVIASPDTLSVQPGSDNTTTVTVTLVSGPTQDVSLSGSWIGGTPSGVSTSFTPSSGNPTYNSSLKFTAASGASQGNYIYRVSATGGGLTRTTDITLVVGEPPFDFSVSASPSSLTIWQGDTGTSTISVTLTSGMPQTVSLSGAWVGTAPSGVTPNLSPSSGTPTYDSVLTFTTTQGATVGTFTYRVTGQSDDLSRTRDITLTINEVTFSFSLSASPDSLTLMRSDSATSTISLNLLAGTAKTVNLSGSWIGTAPTGVSAGFNPSSGIPPFSSTLTLTTTSTASAGTYTYKVSGTGDGLTRTDDITLTIMTELTLTLATDKENYEKGQTIRISGTATDLKGNPVTSGAATIQLSSGDWSRSSSVQIINGAYSDNYQISFGDPEGTWYATITAGDGLGNTGIRTRSIIVATPPGTVYYAVQFFSPSEGLNYPRGTELTISIKLTERGMSVSNADVNFISPTGERIPLSEVPGTGTYSTIYLLGWDAPTGGWSISVEGKKIVDNVLKAGGTNIGVQITPVRLQVTLLSPTKDRVEVWESVEVRVKVLYPNGDPVENAVVTVSTPAGENLALSKLAAGIYSRTYTPRDVGVWGINVAAADLYGNSETKASVIEVVPMGAVGILAAYWWAIPSIIVAIGLASSLYFRSVAPKKRLEGILGEKKEILRLKREAAVKYFKNGSIARETYDELMRNYEGKMMELEKKERVLRASMKRKAKRR